MQAMGQPRLVAPPVPDVPVMSAEEEEAAERESQRAKVGGSRLVMAPPAKWMSVCVCRFSRLFATMVCAQNICARISIPLHPLV
jgi:hypothetical protein